VHRYEREVNHGNQSTIKKFHEADGLPSSMMILCIYKIHSKAVKVELTDGW